MPCDALAVAQAKIDAKYGVELLASDTGLAALAAALAPLMGQVPAIVRQADQSILLQGERITLRITESAIVASSLYANRDQVDALTQRATELAQQLAIPLATERLVNGLKARYGQFAVQDRALPSGARMVKVRIPL